MQALTVGAGFSVKLLEKAKISKYYYHYTCFKIKLLCLLRKAEVRIKKKKIS